MNEEVLTVVPLIYLFLNTGSSGALPGSDKYSSLGMSLQLALALSL